MLPKFNWRECTAMLSRRGKGFKSAAAQKNLVWQSSHHNIVGDQTRHHGVHMTLHVARNPVILLP